MRVWIVAGLVVMTACSKRCARKEAPQVNAPPTPTPTQSASSVTENTPPPPTDDPSPHYVYPSTPDMPDTCLTIAEAVEWRRTLYCYAGHYDPDTQLDAGGNVHASISAKDDLNGDGVPETVSEIAYGDEKEKEVRVYVGGASCATEVGQFDENFEVVATRHDGWADLKHVDGDSYCSGRDVCGCRASETFYIHVKDGGYEEDPSRAVAGKQGHCPFDEPCTTNKECAINESGFVCKGGVCVPPR